MSAFNSGVRHRTESNQILGANERTRTTGTTTEGDADGELS